MEEVHCLYDGEIVHLDDRDSTVTEHMGMLHVSDAKVIRTYTEGPVPGTPAVTRKVYGQGEIWMIGANLSQDDLIRFYQERVAENGLPRVIETDLPPGVAATERENANGRFVFLINTTSEKQQVELPADNTWTEMESGANISTLELDAFQPVVLKRG